MAVKILNLWSFPTRSAGSSCSRQLFLVLNSLWLPEITESNYGPQNNSTYCISLGASFNIKMLFSRRFRKHYKIGTFRLPICLWALEGVRYTQSSLALLPCRNVGMCLWQWPITYWRSWNTLTLKGTRSYSSRSLPPPPQPRSQSEVYKDHGSRTVNCTGRDSPSAETATDALSTIVQGWLSKPQKSIGNYKYMRHYSDFQHLTSAALFFLFKQSKCNTHSKGPLNASSILFPSLHSPLSGCFVFPPPRSLYFYCPSCTYMNAHLTLMCT